MNLLDKLISNNLYHELQKSIHEGLLSSNEAKTIARLKKELIVKCKLSVVNIMKNNLRSCMILLKTKEKTYVFNYVFTNGELSMKGERNNVNIKAN